MTTDDGQQNAFAELRDSIRDGRLLIAELRIASFAMRRVITTAPGPVQENPVSAALHRVLELLEIDLRNTAEMLVGAGEVVRLVGELRDQLGRAVAE